MAECGLVNAHTFDFGLVPESRLVWIDRRSVWGNPYRPGWVISEGEPDHYRSRFQAVALYEELMMARLLGRPGPPVGFNKIDPTTGKRWSGMQCRGAPDLHEQEQEARLWLARLRELDGKLLVCWCKPNICHGEVIVRLVEQLPQLTRRYEEHKVKALKMRRKK